MAVKKVNTLSDLTEGRILKAKTKSVKYPSDWKDFTNDLIETANSFTNCLGLAANQIWDGTPEECPSICIVRWPQGLNEDIEYIWNVMFNPIGKGSGPNIKDYEGCLSFPNNKPKLKRRKKNFLITWIDQTGKTITMKVTGLLARIAQHELDHLNGILLWK